VIFYGVPVVGLCLAVLALAVRCGRGAGALAGAVAALLVALVVVVAQRREGTWLDDAWSLIGGTIMVFAFVALAVGPATALGWPRSGKGEPARPRRD
jgi:8-oxo-dGTP pyrophosphatase MutT (NUDIX family)